MPRNEQGYEKTLTLKVSAEEHRTIKLLATGAGVTIKEFLFRLIDEKFPEIAQIHFTSVGIHHGGAAV